TRIMHYLQHKPCDSSSRPRETDCADLGSRSVLCWNRCDGGRAKLDVELGRRLGCGGRVLGRPSTCFLRGGIVPRRSPEALEDGEAPCSRCSSNGLIRW